jgi:predicted NUDIX family phosphoesterase
MEFVYVAPRAELFPSHYPQGYHPFAGPPEAQAFLGHLLEHGFFVERARAERSPCWKQIIPYCIVAHEGRVLLLRRCAKGGEPRLHDKLSIGIGGHINPVDARNPGELIQAAARREIAEELEVRGEYELRLHGYLNDDSNPVGAVHLGLVHLVNTQGPVRVRERDVLEGRLAATEELRASLVRGDNLESWSSLLIPHLDALELVHPTATT